MFYDYARVSTNAQDLASQLATLKAAGCEKVFYKKSTGANVEWPQLKKLMAVLSPGDMVLTPAVDRLARQQREAAARLQEGKTQWSIARNYNVHQSTITRL